MTYSFSTIFELLHTSKFKTCLKKKRVPRQKVRQDESTGAKPLSDLISERDIRNLHKTLARMNFSNLICLVTHQSPNRAGLFPESAERLSNALERLRPRLAYRAWLTQKGLKSEIVSVWFEIIHLCQWNLKSSVTSLAICCFTCGPWKNF